MQGDLRDVDAALGNRGFERGREMQARGGRCDGTAMGCEEALIIVCILRIGRALAGDIGRERHGAELFDGAVEVIAGKCERKQDFALAEIFEDLGFESCILRRA